MKLANDHAYPISIDEHDDINEGWKIQRITLPKDKKENTHVTKYTGI